MKKDKIVVTGIYTNSYKDVVNLQIHSCKDDYKFDYRYITDEEWQNAKTSKDFAFWGGNIIKTQLVIDKIKENFGGILLVCDADLVFFKPTEKRIRKELKHFDTLFLQERFDKKHQYEKAKANINIGFVAIKCNERNLNFWEEVQAKTQQTHGWDQEIANEILLNKNYNLKWKHFSQKFANGNDINRKNIKKVFIGTSCGTIATRNKLTKVEYLQRLIKYSNSKANEWFDGKTSLKRNKPFEYIFSVKNTPDKKHKIFTIMGVQIKLKQKTNIETIIRNIIKTEISEKITNEICTALSIAKLHTNAFTKFKNINDQKSVCIIGCGPTVEYYNNEINSKNIALNQSIVLNKFRFDYLFCWDYVGIKKKIPDFFENAAKLNCIKFYGKFINTDVPQIPEKSTDKENNIYHFYSSARHTEKNEHFIDYINYDIENQPLMDFASISFPAIQFALYTNPEKIYLIGLDTAQTGNYLGLPNKYNLNKMLTGYKKLKKFVGIYYPDIEIISVNPVGLKGLFKDVYTQSYVEAHPELKNENIEILKPELCETALRN